MKGADGMAFRPRTIRSSFLYTLRAWIYCALFTHFLLFLWGVQTSVAFAMQPAVAIGALDPEKSTFRSPFLHTYDARIGVNAGNSLWLGGCLFRNIKWWDTQSSGGWSGIRCGGDDFFYKNLFTMSEFLFQIEGLSYSESHFFQTCT